MQPPVKLSYPPDTSRSGFTLLEVMIALAIFAIGSLGVAYMLVSGFDTSADSTDLTGGYEVAQSALGLMRASGGNVLQFNGLNTSSNNIPAGATGMVASAISTWSSMVAALPSGYGTISVQSLQGNSLCPCAGLVSVFWQVNGQQEEYTVQSILGY